MHRALENVSAQGLGERVRTRDAAEMDLRRELRRFFLRAALWLLVVPVIGYGFTRYGMARIDDEALAQLDAKLAEYQEPSTSEAQLNEQKAQFRAAFLARPPSARCGDADDPFELCTPFSALWQFDKARAVSTLAIGASASALGLVLLLGALAKRGRQGQLTALSVAWRSLPWIAVFEIVTQGILLVWLSFWITALFFNIYVPKLILLAAIFAVIAMGVAIKAIFARPARITAQDGVLLARANAGGLWQRLDAIAARVGTEPPAHVIAGIDANFFVTESPIASGDRVLEGRTLFVSLPMLRLLGSEEADAVLAHELAHLRGGDTAASARLGPLLVRYDAYTGALGGGGLTRLAFDLLSFFRVVFELARRTESRARELEADRVAASVTSPEWMGRALLKIQAYVSHRSSTEDELFDQSTKHDKQIGINARLNSGLIDHVASSAFRESLAQESVPHPFDTHPSLDTRLASLSCEVKLEEVSRVLAEPVESSWIAGIDDADALEADQWQAYEERFAAAHEQSLAYRYLPANDEEKAIVEKYFPPIEFTEAHARITYDALSTEDGFARWLEVTKIERKDGNFSDVLLLTLPTGTVKVKLRPFGNRKDELLGAVASYWQRAMVAKQPK